MITWIKWLYNQKWSKMLMFHPFLALTTLDSLLVICFISARIKETRFNLAAAMVDLYLRNGEGRLDLDRFLFGIAFLPIFCQNVYIISKKHKSPKIKYLVDDFFQQKWPDKLPPKTRGPSGTSHPPKAATGLISDATYGQTAKSAKNGRGDLFRNPNRSGHPKFPWFFVV